MKYSKAIIVASSFFALLSQPVLAEQSNSSKSKPLIIRAYKSAYSSKVTPDDLIYGMAEVDKMLTDRKPMGFLVEKGDPIYTWAARQFAGEACGERISWNPEEDLGKPTYYKADHCFPTKDEKGYIRLRSNNGSGNVYDEHVLWEGCIFELLDIRNFKAFDKVYEDGCKGKFTKDEWIRLNTLISYKTDLAAKDFFYRNWSPYLKDKGIDPEEHKWQVDSAPKTYNEWIGQYTDKSGYPWDYWGTYYDTQIVPYVEATKGK
ncbi:hypothetical protein KA183_06460 [bacterium]|nr:hypothetical protein [bacterium]QQR56242.1 MAG: hypothetical protein IPG59_14660 [Candidatus Melainabacteria bacterium]